MIAATALSAKRSENAIVAAGIIVYGTVISDETQIDMHQLQLNK
jgi:hypothetical protein